MLLGIAVNAQKKNIVFLFADDSGYHDFGFQGSKTFKTPNLDKLASEGVVCTQAYTTAAVCGPSRAGLLTGMYQQRFGFEENNINAGGQYMSNSSGQLGSDMGLPTHLKTIADYLHPLGYKSIVLGKWHMGHDDKYHPLKRGFDEFYGFRSGARKYFKMTQKEAADHPSHRMERGLGNFKEPEKYVTDKLADEACDFIERNKNKPFFAYVSFNAVHGPLMATKEDLAKVEHLTGKRKILAAMAISLDRACGQILDKLKELGLEENTLVVFSNDNGGPHTTKSCNYPLSGCKATHLEGGIRVPFIFKMPNEIQPNTKYDYPVSMLDMLPTFVNAAGGNATKIKDLDGVDLMPYLTNKNKNRPHEMLFWKKENRGVVRKGDWKLIRYPDRPAELYNIVKDASESKNLAFKYPEKVKEMFKLLFKWEGTLERPKWMLQRKYETRALKMLDTYRTPVLDEVNK
ncbi:sulfatase [Wenyingzhuangia sp. IMCC45574]